MVDVLARADNELIAGWRSCVWGGVTVLTPLIGGGDLRG